MDESYVKQKLVEDLLREKIVSYRIEDLFRAGLPDMLVARAQHSLWIEVKYSEDPFLPWTWRAYKPHQSESGRRLSLITGIPFIYYCRNNAGQFTISTIKSVIECITTKQSLLYHENSYYGVVKDVPRLIGKILDEEVKINA